MPAAGNYNNAVSKIDIKYNTAVHLFSNILDIESIDLKKLATLIAGTGYIHYFLCTGPINSGNYRIDAFSRYFNIHDDGSIFSDFRSGQYNTLANDSERQTGQALCHRRECHTSEIFSSDHFPQG